MNNSLFIVNLPLVNTNKELKKIKKIYHEYDQYFIANGCIEKRRKKFDKLWNNFKPYADKHFLNEIKTNFHQRSWEMYIGNVLLKKKLSIKKWKNQNDGPDFIVEKIKNDKSRIYIECVAPTKGIPNKQDSVPEPLINKNQNVPSNQIILRITQAIKEKSSQYKKWEDKKWFEKNTPFVIAINTGDMGYLEDPDMPNVVKALFGFQYMQINIKTGETSYSQRNDIKKSNNKSIPVNYFNNDKLSFISGVLFSNKLVLHHPENIGDDCFFINNPFSRCPVDKKFAELFKNWNAQKDDNKNEIILQKNY